MAPSARCRAWTGPSRRASQATMQVTRPSRGPCRRGPYRPCPFAAAALAAATTAGTSSANLPVRAAPPIHTRYYGLHVRHRKSRSSSSVNYLARRGGVRLYYLARRGGIGSGARSPSTASHIMSKPPSDHAAMAGLAPIQSSSVALRGRTSCENVSNGASSTSPLMVARSTYTLRPDALCATIEPRACRFASHPDPHVRKSRGAHYERVAARERIQTDSGPQTSHALMVP